jgi:hypothetical protein
LRIGAPYFTNGDQSALFGAVDELRIYNRALSAAEIKLLATVP